MELSGPDDPSVRRQRHGGCGASSSRHRRHGEVAVEEEVVNTPVVKSDWDKTPRNAPCPCGSGKKFKNCHGTA
jgi:preprotein translocase subunit SecA